VKFQWMWFQVREPGPAGEWDDVGVVLLADGVISFHPRRGFESAGARVAVPCERATAAGTADELWEYFIERGAGGYSTFSDPDTLDAEDRTSAAGVLLDRGTVQHDTD
jgi:hypothetical protein